MKSLAGCGLLAGGADVIRIYLATILILSGTSKLVKRVNLTPVLQALGVPMERRRLPTAIVTASEILLGGWLLTGIWLNTALIVTGMLFMTFTLLLYGLIQKGYNGPCACFGSLDRHTIGKIQITRNLFLILLSVFATIGTFQYSCHQLAVWELPAETFLLVGVGLVLTATLYFGLLEMEEFHKRVQRITHDRSSHFTRID